MVVKRLSNWRRFNCCAMMSNAVSTDKGGSWQAIVMTSNKRGEATLNGPTRWSMNYQLNTVDRPIFFFSSFLFLFFFAFSPGGNTISQFRCKCGGCLNLACRSQNGEVINWTANKNELEEREWKGSRKSRNVIDGGNVRKNE